MVTNFLGGLAGGAAGGAAVSILITAKDMASGTLGHVSRSSQQMAAQYQASGMMMIGAAGGIVAALGSTVKAAAAEEAGIKKLSQAMANVGLSYDNSRESLERWIDAQQQATSFADSEQREALSQLILFTNDLTKAQDLLTVAMDVSAGTGKELSSVTTLIGYAMSGNWGMVTRMIPALKQAQTEEERWMMLRTMFAGQAEAYGSTMEGTWKTFQNNISDFKEAMGDVLIPVLMPFVEGLKDMAQALKEVPEPVLRVGVVMAALAAGMLGVRGVINLFKGFNLMLGGTKVGLNGVTTAAPGAATGISRIGAIAQTTAFQVAGLAAGISMLIMGIMQLQQVKAQHAELQSLAEAYNADKSVANAQALLEAMKAQQAAGTFKPGPESQQAMANLEEYVNANTTALGDAGAAGLEMGDDLALAFDESTDAAQETAEAVYGIGAAAQQAGGVAVQSMGAVTAACGKAGAGLAAILNILSGGAIQATGGRLGNVYDTGVYMTPDEAYRKALAGEYGDTALSQAWASEAARIYGSGTAVVWSGDQLANALTLAGPAGSTMYLVGTGDKGNLYAITNPNSTQGETIFAKGYASGGWAGLRGPELAWLGEREPELVIPRSQVGKGNTTVKVYLGGREVSDLVIKRVERDIN